MPRKIGNGIDGGIANGCGEMGNLDGCTGRMSTVRYTLEVCSGLESWWRRQFGLVALRSVA